MAKFPLLATSSRKHRQALPSTELAYKEEQGRMAKEARRRRKKGEPTPDLFEIQKEDSFRSPLACSAFATPKPFQSPRKGAAKGTTHTAASPARGQGLKGMFSKKKKAPTDGAASPRYATYMSMTGSNGRHLPFLGEGGRTSSTDWPSLAPPAIKQTQSTPSGPLVPPQGYSDPRIEPATLAASNPLLPPGIH
jgi:hypothetical protein